jgi:tetratricopeptide (TPR) repeat protein
MTIPTYFLLPPSYFLLSIPLDKDKIIMKCINCNSELPEGAKFCPECGSKVSTSDQPPENQVLDTTRKSTPFSKPVHAFTLIIGAVAIAILIVILILDSNREKREETANTSTNTSNIPPEIQAKLEVLAANPESIPLNIEMGNILFDINRFNEAIPFYQKALRLDPLNIGVQIDLAVCFFNLQNFEQAIVEMDKALKIDPNHPKGLFNMGIIYYSLNRPDDVHKYWEKLMIVHPQSMEAKRAEELLQNLN